MREAERFYARALDLVDPDDAIALELRDRRGRALVAGAQLERQQSLSGRGHEAPWIEHRRRFGLST
jgi:hypothetical protein